MQKINKSFIAIIALSMLSGALSLLEIYIFVNLNNSDEYLNLVYIFIIKTIISILVIISQNILLFKFEEKFLQLLVIRLTRTKNNITQGNIVKILTTNMNAVFHAFGSGSIALVNDIFFILFYAIGLVYVSTQSIKLHFNLSFLLMVFSSIIILLVLLIYPIKTLIYASKSLNYGLNIYSDKIKDLADFIKNKVNILDEKKFVRYEIDKTFKYSNKYQILQFSLMESFKSYLELICAFFLLAYIIAGGDSMKSLAAFGVILFRLLPIAIKIFANINRVMSGIPTLKQINEI
ncbi:hypothetical protein AOC06_01670 [Polynucleobacter paludilacus]|uniref:hypothetical protein n=1 Tax=Polynucleobacter paludilacus TaxID=1855895 RepID=UPI001BFD9F1F|nr:hypothetical protein [Polynucleobacter paludilacus]QWD87316.1 hypothetical protein AOC06_01670 [Polynucleobacter paludilacus]